MLNTVVVISSISAANRL